MKIKKLNLIIFIFISVQSFTQFLFCNQKNLFKEKLERLITSNVVWARQYIISLLTDSPDKQAIKKRLLKNQDRFGKILSRLYGNEAGSKITKLLQEHKNITLNLVDAIKNKDVNKEKEIEKQWYKNIKDIAVSINKYNSKLPVNYLTKILNKLLKLTKQEIVLRVNKEWEADIHNFDKIMNYAAVIAENLSNKIFG